MADKKKWLLGSGVFGAGGCGLLGGGGVVALIVGVAVAPYLLAGPAKTAVEDQLAESLDATVTLGDVSVSLFSAFPRTTVIVKDVEVVNNAPFKGVKLASIPEARVSVSLASLLSGDMNVSQIKLTDPAFDVRVTRKGKANYDIVKDTGEEEEPEDPDAPYSMSIDELKVTNLSLKYLDKASKIRFAIKGLDHTSSADLSDTLASLDTSTEIESLSLKYGRVRYLRDTRWKAVVKVDYDQKSGRITLGDNRIEMNAMAVDFQGWAEPKGKEDWTMDLSWKSLDTSFAALLSMVPRAYGKAFEGVKADGTFSVTGSAKGLYDADHKDHLPGFDLDVTVQNGSFAYPSLPSSVKRVSMDMKIKHPEGSYDKTVINIKELGLTTAKSPFDMSLLLKTPMSDPYIKTEMKGTLDLGALAAAVPEETAGSDVSGVMTMDIAVDGSVKQFQRGNKKARASGDFAMRDFVMDSEDLPVKMRVDRMDLALNPKKAKLKTAKVRWGKGSDLQASGQITDIVPYLLAEDGVLTGRLDLTSKTMDVRAFQKWSEGEETEEPASSEDGVVVAVPGNIDFEMDGSFGKVVTQDLTMTDVRTALSVRDHTARIEDLSAKALGGRVQMTGTYKAPTDKHADVDFDMAVVDMSLPKTLAAFETVGAIAPVLKGAGGVFDGNFNLVTRITKNGTPVLDLLESLGSFQGDRLDIAPGVLATAASQLKLGKLGKLQPGNVGYRMRKGKLRVEPFAAKLGGKEATIAGKAGVVDKTLDFTIDLPLPGSVLKSTGLAAAAGGGDVPVQITIGGTYAKPKVGLGKAGAVDAIASGLIGKASALGDQLIATAEAAGDKLIEEAEKAAEVVRKEAKKQGDKLVAKAGDPLAKAGAKEAAKQLNNQADQKAKKLVDEAKKAKKKLVADAQDEKDKLIDDAKKGKAPSIGGGKSKSKSKGGGKKKGGKKKGKGKRKK